MKSKILSIIIIMLIFIIALTNINYASVVTEDRSQTIDSVIGGADDFISGADTLYN